ncbi:MULTISPECIES: amino acid ABC transporter permease [unclassified Rhizobium]|uniref:amino acid ABC transporter permease n=1 Tax=unclassified Rhizobium TaxID=2613769 RepID=UPI001447FA55|nr:MULTISPECIES: amino acid ABC transporter permease [unclassified Rhizobium]NKJ08605.1 polar amino acid transport system permease protein [Rhizobium sp. SG741]NKJ37445.1 polar amino acid transport system permease protein [Rhizobium sp. SG570]NRP89129.1 L-cystine transport system permease protein YecS [Ensifer adhaerens]
MTLIDTFFNTAVLSAAVPALLRGLVNTIILGLLAIGLGVPLGMLVSLVRLYAPSPFRWLAIGFIDICRALPVLVVLILIYYALPFVGIRFSALVSATLAFTIVMSAYSAEVFRTGIESIPRGQFEAAQALGLPFVITLRKVILPQAMKLVIPPTTSNCVSMFKDTSLASVVALPELLKDANDAQALYANPTPLIGAALIYLAFLWPMVRLVSYIERRNRAATIR